MAMWGCRVVSCNVQFDSLFDLISHMRGSHPSSAMICGIEHCPKTFSSPGVWYWHIRNHHLAEYLKGKRKRRPENAVESPQSRESTTCGMSGCFTEVKVNLFI